MTRDPLTPLQPVSLPTYGSPEEQRADAKRRLAAAFRLRARFGYDEGPAGHITVRDPERRDHFWVNPFGMHFSMIRSRDLILVNHSGEVVEGSWPVNVAAFAIHSAIHRARPDVNAAAHCHSVHGKAFSSLGKLLDPLTQDACAFYEDHALFDDYTGVVLDVGEGERIAAALGSCKAAILRNHGLITVGESVDSAVWWFIAMDRSCHAQLLADAAGPTVKIDHPNAKLTHSQVGSDIAGWFSFQPMYEWIVRQEPDLLD
jgi:ribulose-5-phosphate 4-epimerase/fuculose-1-phosphate aldolase